MKDMKTSTFARLAEVRARALAQAEEARKMLEANPPPSLAELVAVTTARFKAALGPDAPLPPSLSSLRNREAVERLSLEGKPVGEIARTLGISYGYVVMLRAELGVSRPRRRR